MTTLLLGQGHNHSELFQRPQAALAPFYVKRAEAYIEANLDQPLSVAELAAQAGVSARSLQAGFQQYRGTTPMAYLRELRLKRVHEALLSADPQHSSVTDIALQSGFGHLGKFSVAYKQRFGESPAPPSAAGVERNACPVSSRARCGCPAVTEQAALRRAPPGANISGLQAHRSDGADSRPSSR